MKKLLIILLMFSFAACSKIADKHSPSEVQPPFFKNADEVSVLVKSAIKKLKLDGELKSIGHISYLQTGTKDLAFIFYASTKGDKNMVVIKDHTASLLDDGGSVSVCQDGSCDCKVRAVFHNDGSVTVDCSCTSCKMVTSYDIPLNSLSGASPEF